MTTEHENLKQIIEAALFSFGEPLSTEKLLQLFPEAERPEAAEVREKIAELQEEYKEKSIELVRVASGYRFQAKPKYSPWLQRLWEKRPPKYTRAFLETLALIAYKQPITRGEIEEVRGVSVSSNIIKTLQEREWIKVVGYKEVPGKPALFGTTKQFLDYFNLKSLSQLPPLEELMDLDEIAKKIDKELGFKVVSSESEQPQADQLEDEVAESVESSDEIVEETTTIHHE